MRGYGMVLASVASLAFFGAGTARAVDSQDGMTADWVKLPYELLETLSRRITNEVKGINRVCFDISSKPPATIEWE